MDERSAAAAWDALFARSQHVLVAMAAEAVADFRAGRTMPLDTLVMHPDAYRALWAMQPPMRRKMARFARTLRS